MIYINSGIFPVAVTTQSACHFRRFTSHSRPPIHDTYTSLSAILFGVLPNPPAPTLSDCNSTHGGWLLPPIRIIQFFVCHVPCPRFGGGHFLAAITTRSKPSRCAVFRVDVCRTRRFSTILLIYYPPTVRHASHLFPLLFHSSLRHVLVLSFSHCQYISFRIFHFPFHFSSPWSLIFSLFFFGTFFVTPLSISYSSFCLSLTH